MLKKWFILSITMIISLTACHSPVYNQTEANVAEVKLKAESALRFSDISARRSSSLVVRRGAYIDTTPVLLSREPAWLRNPIVIRGDQLPFSYYSRTIASGAGNNILTKYQTGLDPALIVSLSYSGTIKGALDLLAAKTGYVYNVHTNSVFWQSVVTRTFDVAFMPGSADYLMGKASGSSVGSSGNTGAQQNANFVTSDSSNDEFSNLKGTLSIWRDLETTIKQMLSPLGTVSVSESTTTVTVRDRPSNVQLVGQYIYNLNRNLSRQVLVKVEVLEVNLENDFNFGINWQIIARAFNKSPFVINGSYGTPISITPLTPQSALPGGVVPPVPVFGTQVQPGTDNPIPSYTILVNALNQQGKTSVVSQPRTVCLNNQVCVIRIVNQEGYLASVQNTSLAGTSTGSTSTVGTVTSQLTPGTLTTGLTLYILPKILKNRVYIQVNADISTKNSLLPVSSGSSADANNSVIYVPNVTQKHFNQRSMLHSGDTLILSGFKQMRNVANANQFITLQALGGKASVQQNLETIILITPIVLCGSA